MPKGYVYILASHNYGTLYIGVTNNPVRRITEHREGNTPGFSAKYHVHRLVHLETYDRIEDAIAREKQLKKWNRAWKINLIEKDNPKWNDLYPALIESSLPG